MVDLNMSFNAVLVTIILGALGSGAWIYLFDPLGRRCIRWIGNKAASSSRTIRNRLYTLAARRQQDAASLYLVRILVMASLLGVGATAGYLAAFISHDAQEIEKQDQALSTPNLSAEERQRVVAEAKRELGRLQDHLRSSERRLAYGSVGTTTLLFFLLLSDLVVLSFVSSVRTYFDLCLATLAPHLQPPEELILRSAYARMVSREDYDRILANFRTISERSGIPLPKQNI